MEEEEEKKKEGSKHAKKNMTAYMFFCAAKRGERRTISLRELGTAWREANECDKREYVALATQDKQRYDAKMHTSRNGAATGDTSGGGDTSYENNSH